MRVLIDEGLSTVQQLGGIGYQSVNLWKHLKQKIDCDITDYHYLQHFPRIVKRAVYLGIANIEPHIRKYDVIHYQNYYIPRYLGDAKGITTIHDLGGLSCPDVYPSWYNTYFRKVLQNAVKRSDTVIVPSYAVKNELFGLFSGSDTLQIYVCHNGIRSIFFETRSTEYPVPLNLKPHSYFLCVGNLEKRKNLPLLLSQFVVARNNSLIDKNTKLVLVGKLGIGYEGFKSLISERNNIIHLGRLNDSEIVTLYKHCKAFVFPSLYEGFGIPILEAMSQKVPILMSNILPSLELNRRHGDQCFVFELGRDETLVEMLSYLDKNFDSVSAQLDYGDLSIYSYDRIAVEHINIYRQVL